MIISFYANTIINYYLVEIEMWTIGELRRRSIAKVAKYSNKL